MKTVKEEIAANLLFYRKKAKLTQQKLADALGVKNNTVSQWESGANSIDVEVLFKICEVLNVSINDMFGIFATAGGVSPRIPITLHEQRVIAAYRNNPSMQAGIDKLLGVDDMEAAEEIVPSTIKKGVG